MQLGLYNVEVQLQYTAPTHSSRVRYAIQEKFGKTKRKNEKIKKMMFHCIFFIWLAHISDASDIIHNVYVYHVKQGG